jgi:hypothetical protein
LKLFIFFLEIIHYMRYSISKLNSARRFHMSVRCPRCEEIIPERTFDEIQEWGPEAMKCHYCGCPLSKSIYAQRRWEQMFPALEKTEDDLVKTITKKTKEMARQVGRSANELKNEYFM